MRAGQRFSDPDEHIARAGAIRCQRACFNDRQPRLNHILGGVQNPACEALTIRKCLEPLSPAGLILSLVQPEHKHSTVGIGEGDNLGKDLVASVVANAVPPLNPAIDGLGLVLLPAERKRPLKLELAGFASSGGDQLVKILHDY